MSPPAHARLGSSSSQAAQKAADELVEAERQRLGVRLSAVEEEVRVAGGGGRVGAPVGQDTFQVGWR